MDNVTANLFKWISDSSIRELVHFHNDIRNMIAGHYSDSDNDEKTNLNRTLEGYAETLATSCFLLLYARTEETLQDLWRIKLPNRPLPDGGIGRYKELFHNVGIEIDTYKPWDKLQDASALRHCLLHANGRINLMRKPHVIIEITKRAEGIRISNNRIYVGARYLASFGQVVTQLRDDLVGIIR